jgi:hypothetical protein
MACHGRRMGRGSRGRGAAWAGGLGRVAARMRPRPGPASPLFSLLALPCQRLLRLTHCNARTLLLPPEKVHLGRGRQGAWQALPAGMCARFRGHRGRAARYRHQPALRLLCSEHRGRRAHGRRRCGVDAGARRRRQRRRRGAGDAGDRRGDGAGRRAGQRGDGPERCDAAVRGAQNSGVTPRPRPQGTSPPASRRRARGYVRTLAAPAAGPPAARLAYSLRAAACGLGGGGERFRGRPRPL